MATVAGESWDAIVVGGGFFGCNLALMLADSFSRVLVVERDADLMQRASYANQARVHGGYHYPRSILTGLRSQANFARFIREYAGAIDRDFAHYYAIARKFSNVTALQFARFCQEIGAPVRKAPPDVRRLFDLDLVEEVFEVTEYAFDSVRLKEHLLVRMAGRAIPLRLGTEARRATARSRGIQVDMATGPESWSATTRWLFNCTYSRINHLLHKSEVPLIPLRHEYTEIALIETPEKLRKRAVTVMCGPFFSTMPFPPAGTHSLSHVRYTPHYDWEERPGGAAPMMLDREAPGRASHCLNMIMDAKRFLPCLERARQLDSLWEVKTVLPQCEVNDARPILFKAHDEVPGLVSVLGGKFDNIYDLPRELQMLFSRAEGQLV